jgi:hypothetical protein
MPGIFTSSKIRQGKVPKATHAFKNFKASFPLFRTKTSMEGSISEIASSIHKESSSSSSTHKMTFYCSYIRWHVLVVFAK